MNWQTSRELHDGYHNRLLYSMVSVVKNREEAEDITLALNLYAGLGATVLC
jgi:hypothetical protein